MSTTANNCIEEVDRVNIEYYTDPLCCWSWAFEQHWRKFLNENAAIINSRYRMCGLIPDWKRYNDPLNDISRPIQMAPYWSHAKQTTGVYFDEQIWMEDPPESSYPACIAVKCAEKQSVIAGDLYLQQLRRSVMTLRKNISKRQVLIAAAYELEQNYPNIINTAIFEKDIYDNTGLEAFREDVLKAKYHNISRFPSITMSKKGTKGILLVGYRPYEVFMEAFNVLIQAGTSISI